MSSLNPDQENVDETVRRTRSGRTVKTPVAKKKPVRKTRSQKADQTLEVEEVVTVEEEESSGQLDEIPENGMFLSDVNVEPCMEDKQLIEAMDVAEENQEAEQFEEQIQSDICIQNLQESGNEMIVNECEQQEFNPQIDETMDSQQFITEFEGEASNQQQQEFDLRTDETMDNQQFVTEFLEETSNQPETLEIESNLSTSDAVQEENITNVGMEFITKENVGIVEDSSSAFKQEESVEMKEHNNEAERNTEEEPVQQPIQSNEDTNELEKIEPDTEAVSEDELPNETKEPETEAVSDEELPVAATADLGETESVSEDELPPDSDKKKKPTSKLNVKASEKPKSNGGVKRKMNTEGEYDPNSPTSENNDEAPAKKVALASGADNEDSKSETKPASPKKKVLPELEKYWKAVNEDPSDFTGWTYLLQYVDQENDAEAAREAYTKFLQRYPYCYGYWRKFADYEKKKGNPENVQTVFDQGLKAISLSVDLWLHYINHCKVVYEKDEEKMRAQYERAIQACGLEFRSDRLWESYIKWETEGKRLNKVLALYDRLLSTPTMGYIVHFEAFQEFVSSNAPNRFLSVDNFLALRQEVKAMLKSDEGNSVSDDAPPGEDLPPHEIPPTDEETRAIREKIISSRRKMHKANVNAVAARWTFEEGIKRPYFHVKPLERCQLKNWKEYLDYEIEQKDHNRIVILFERCLIACALYDEFWMRFIRYLESLKGDYSEKIRDVYTRACTIHHPKTPNLHLQWATFEENQGNFTEAANILENVDKLNLLPNTLQIAYRRINLERRRGDLEKASTLYEHYINTSNRSISNHILVKYARFLCKIKNDIDKAISILLKATEKDKDNPRLYLQLIDLGLQRMPIDIQEIVGYMDLFIDREHADLEQRVLFAQRKVEFLEDFSPDIRQVLKAHEQFQKCIKQAKDRKKSKTEDNKVDATPPKKTKTNDQTAAPPPPSMSSQSSYQYGGGPSGPYQSQQQFQGSQYSGQGGYQQGYQQYPPPSDPNYANYQNWQYGQGGPQAYGPYNQWGSYNYY